MPADDFKLRGGFVAHLRAIADHEEELGKYYHFASKFWRAIVDHLYNIPTCVILDHPANHYIPFDHAHGPCISFKGAHLFPRDYSEPGKPKEQKVFNLSVRITYIHDDNRDEFNPVSFERAYALHVPLDLEVDFTQEKFNAWIEEKRKFHEDADRRAAAATIKQLRDKFPDLF